MAFRKGRRVPGERSRARNCHDHSVDDAKVVEGELILPKDAEALRARDRAFGRLELPGKNLHQSGFAGTVGTGDGVAAARHEGAGDILKQDARTEAHGDIVDREHNLPSIADESLAAGAEGRHAGPSGGGLIRRQVSGGDPTPVVSGQIAAKPFILLGLQKYRVQKSASFCRRMRLVGETVGSASEFCWPTRPRASVSHSF